MKNALAIGASYSLKNRGIDELNSPGFEVSLTYLFGKQKRGAPVYSFVNAVRPKAKRQSTVARRTTTALAKEVTPPSTAPSGQADKPVVRKQAPVSVEDPVPADEEKRDVIAETEAEPTQSTPEDRSPEDRSPPIDHTEPAIDKIGVARPLSITDEHANADARESDAGEMPPTAEDTAVPSASNVRHEIVNRGDNAEALPPAHYVVAATFTTRDNAAYYAEGLDRLGLDARLGYVNAKGLWYVTISEGKDLDAVRRQQARFAEQFLLRDAWLLTVEP